VRQDNVAKLKEKHILPNFNHLGYLPPNEYEVNLDIIYDNFVKLYTKTSTRHYIFDRFSQYCKDCPEGLITIYIDGSFVTSKENPKDIDCILFYDHNALADMRKNNHPHYIYSRIDKKTHTHNNIKRHVAVCTNLIRYNCDTYYEPYYPEGHLLHKDYLQSYKNWSYFLGHDRKRIPKGFLKISGGALQ